MTDILNSNGSAFCEALKNTKEFCSVTEDVRKKLLPVAVTGLSAVTKAFFAGAVCESTCKKALVICEDEAAAIKVRDDLNAMYSGALLYPAKDISLDELESKSREYEHLRLGTLVKICDDDFNFIVTGAAALKQFTIPRAELKKHCMNLMRGDDIERDELTELFLKSGYVRSEQVEGIGQFSVRGDIVDFFPPQSDEPVRLDFWGDTIEQIYTFSVSDQRRSRDITSVKIVPAAETLFDSDEEFCEKLKKQLKRISRTKNEKAKRNLADEIHRLEGGIRPLNADRYFPLAYEKNETLFDYLSDCLIFECESAAVKEALHGADALLNLEIKTCLENGSISKGLDAYALKEAEVLKILAGAETVVLDSLPRGTSDFPLKDLYGVFSQTLPFWSGKIKDLTDDIKASGNKAQIHAVMAGTEKNAKAVYNDLISEAVPAVYFSKIPSAFPRGSISVISGTLTAGLRFPDAGLSVYSIGRTATSTKRKNRKHRAGEIHSLEEISVGDYIVHNIHGIGIYMGVFPVETGGIKKDYIKINYAGSDILYVPVTQLDLVSKYIGPEGARVKVNKLGSTEWLKAKKRAKAGIKDIAKDLVQLYAKRMKTKGHAFMEDDDLQRDFELRFPYEETDDQIRCIQEIKKDMCSPHPMDRLLCGDVGFGKTEVALRAAFKCMEEGKQVAMLVPTTILALQHYQTASARMANFALNIDMLSRFRTPAEQKKTREKLKDGKIDMIIGTHKLISKNVDFKDLGLLIIDEEQRFGVSQKEALKTRFPAVDILTLSATPIPRTLNMAMSGIRDMSVIEEAPLDRHPVQTYVTAFERGIITEAIRKELRRGGQVYYLHNRVEDIERTAIMLREDFPDAKIGIAHGQMSEKQLSDIWQKLINCEIDILVCTTIIETGVDVPNVNTLIIENADRMGLAQLHQIRGRVGRSGRRASAYLTYYPMKVLTDDATKRLEAIREYTQFGSGFKIAMRDLEIRGAGNLLGSKQHGNMEAVGYDMYVKLLSSAVAEQKGEPEPEPERECLVDLPITAHISEKYIPSVTQRIAMYRRIADIRNEEDAADVTDELNDRFGPPDSTVMGLIRISLLRAAAVNAGIYEITQNGRQAILKLTDIDLYILPKLQKEMKRVIQLNAGNNKPFISINLLKGDDLLETVGKALKIISGGAENA